MKSIITDYGMVEYDPEGDEFGLEWAFDNGGNVAYCPVWCCWVVVGNYLNQRGVNNDEVDY